MEVRDSEAFGITVCAFSLLVEAVVTVVVSVPFNIQLQSIFHYPNVYLGEFVFKSVF